MGQGRLQARLDKLMLPKCKVGKIAVIFPDDWAEEPQAAYDAASGAGDTVRMAEIILQETGEQVSFDDDSVNKVIEVRPEGWSALPVNRGRTGGDVAHDSPWHRRFH